jgi:hypothetical protein
VRQAAEDAAGQLRADLELLRQKALQPSVSAETEATAPGAAEAMAEVAGLQAQLDTMRERVKRAEQVRSTYTAPAPAPGRLLGRVPFTFAAGDGERGDGASHASCRQVGAPLRP